MFPVHTSRPAQAAAPEFVNNMSLQTSDHYIHPTKSQLSPKMHELLHNYEATHKNTSSHGVKTYKA